MLKYLKKNLAEPIFIKKMTPIMVNEALEQSHPWGFLLHIKVGQEEGI